MLAAPSATLIMNLVIAAAVLIAFSSAYWLDRSQKGLLWSAIATVSGTCGAAIEVVIPHLDNLLIPLVLSYGLYLGMVAAISIAVAHARQIKPPYRLFAFLIGLFVAIQTVNFWIGYESLLRFSLHQSGYAVLQAFAIYYAVKGRPRDWADWNLLGAMVASTFQYPLRPFLAYLTGYGDDAAAYLTADYATIAQIIFAATIVWVAIALIIFHLQVIVRSLNRKAGTDPLTGLANRRELERHLQEHERCFSARLDQHAVILLDVDHFKAVNDSCGHAAGDAVLRSFCEIIRSVLGSSHTAARLGGEEFVLIIRHCELQTARLCAEGLRMAFEMVSLPELGGQKVTASFGVSAWRRGQSFSKALTLADAALYRAKTDGRNRVVVDEAVSSAAREVPRSKSNGIDETASAIRTFG